MVERMISTSVDQTSSVQMFGRKLRMSRGSNPHQTIRSRGCCRSRRGRNSGSSDAQVGDAGDQMVAHRIKFDETNFLLKTKQFDVPLQMYLAIMEIHFRVQNISIQKLSTKLILSFRVFLKNVTPAFKENYFFQQKHLTFV
jgi:hypothetical protein